MPSAAIAEWQAAPVGLLERIIEYRAFAAAKNVVDNARDKDQIPDTPMTALVQEIEYDLVKARVAARER